MDGRIDSIILLAAQKAGLDVSSCFPSDLIIWVSLKFCKKKFFYLYIFPIIKKNC